MKKYILLASCFICLCLQAQEFKAGKIDKSWFEIQLTEEQQKAPAVYLEKYRRTHFEYRDELDGWTLFTTIHNVIKILDTEGLEYANTSLRLYKEGREDQKIDKVDAFSYALQNGKVEREKVKNGDIIINDLTKNVTEMIIPIPAVKVGSIVEYTYRMESTFWTIRDLIIQEDIPVKHAYAKVEIPQFFDYNKYVKGYLKVEPKLSVESRSENFSVEAKNPFGGKIANTSNFANIKYKENVAEYEFNNVAAINVEPFVNNLDNYRSSVEFELAAVEFNLGKKVNRSKTWDQVATYFYNDLEIGESLNKTNFLKATANDIKARPQGNKQKIEQAYRTIQERMTWNQKNEYISSPDIRAAFERKSGTAIEINTILVALLRELGISSHPIMASTKSNGIALLPTISGFNYILAGVQQDGKWTALDATEKNAPIGILPERILNWEGRLVNKNGTTEAIPLFANTYSEEKAMIIAKIAEDGTITGKIRKQYSENESLEFINTYKPLTETVRLNVLNDHFKAENKSDIAFKFSNVRKPSNVSFSFSDEDNVESLNDKLYIKPQLFLQKTNNPLQNQNRKYPLDFKYPTSISNTVTINIPDAYKIESIPEDFKITLSNGLGEYRFTSKSTTGRSVQTLSVLTINKTLVGPEFYQELRDFYSQLIAKEKESIVLDKI